MIDVAKLIADLEEDRGQDLLPRAATALRLLVAECKAWRDGMPRYNKLMFEPSMSGKCHVAEGQRVLDAWHATDAALILETKP